MTNKKSIYIPPDKAHSYLEMIDSFIKTFPNAIILLDENNKILSANEHILDEDLKLSFVDFIGKRPGDGIQCENTKKPDPNKICMERSSCQYCGIYQAIIKSKQKASLVIEEARVKSIIKNGELNFDFRIISIPVNIGELTYTLLIFEDISKEKRKNALEHIFFHDVLNTAGNIRNIIELLQDPQIEKDSFNHLLEIAEQASNQLVEEISAQRQLSLAEKGALKVENKELNSIYFLQALIEQCMHLPIVDNKEIVLDHTSEEIIFYSDPILLKRILLNMVKNALEASNSNETVTLNIKRSRKSFIRFSVHNNTVIEDSVSHQLFKRSFSTKGINRGLGTYSMALLGRAIFKRESSLHKHC